MKQCFSFSSVTETGVYGSRPSKPVLLVNRLFSSCCPSLHDYLSTSPTSVQTAFSSASLLTVFIVSWRSPGYAFSTSPTPRLLLAPRGRLSSSYYTIHWLSEYLYADAPGCLLCTCIIDLDCMLCFLASNSVAEFLYLQRFFFYISCMAG